MDNLSYFFNGNLTKDLNRDIWSIEYNCLNLPESVSFGDDSYILYTYNAKGEKMSVAYLINQMTPAVPQVGGGTGGGEPQTRFTLVYYWNGLVFEGNTLKQIPIEGGYVTFNGSTPQYHFYIQDHLGNNRLVCNSRQFDRNIMLLPEKGRISLRETAYGYAKI